MTALVDFGWAVVRGVFFAFSWDMLTFAGPKEDLAALILPGMTKRRATNKKPTGVNRSLGNCLSNERERVRTAHRHKERGYEADNKLAPAINFSQKAGLGIFFVSLD
ncbi:unnamed protein product [Gongylonema pulchrum]|uniref:Secreted protein n=1 Tax=Gongylonema pulchrum TaxID=637853 RepID=A0A183E8S3_9BILA|nr:unnamed protein product [Gongylonema pulchrum]